MDTLSDILSLLKLQSYVSGSFEAGGDWSVGFAAEEGMKFYAAIAGACWLSVDGVPEPLRITAGDCLLLPSGRAFRVASDLRLPPVSVRDLTSTIKAGGGTRVNGGGDFLCLAANFTVAGEDADFLIRALPPVVLLRDEDDKAMLRWCIERMRAELREPQPGSSLVARQLATMLLVAALRLHLADRATVGVGWLFALSDPQMAAAIDAMHRDPAQRWTVQSLAERAGMSRTSFTLRFKETVGSSPMEYLTRWRMMLAADRLARSSDSIADISLALGYESESAFGSAFKRHKGCSPRRYSRSRSSAPEAVAS